MHYSSIKKFSNNSIMDCSSTLPGSLDVYKRQASHLFFSLIRRPPALPHRLQCSTIGRLGLNPVSYTHLDVYKRQLKYFKSFIRLKVLKKCFCCCFIIITCFFIFYHSGRVKYRCFKASDVYKRQPAHFSHGHGDRGSRIHSLFWPCIP